MILNNLVFCIDENKKFVNGSIPSGKITANDINSNFLYVITPSPIRTLIKASFQNEMQNETPETVPLEYVGDKIRVDDLVPKNAPYYNMVKDWNVFTSGIPAKSLEMISYSRAGMIGVSFNFTELIVPQAVEGYDYIADITNPDYIPNMVGYYVVKVAVYEFGGFEFTYNDILIKTSTGVVKRRALTIVKNTNTLRYSIDPSIYTQNFEAPEQDIVDLILLSISDVNQKVNDLISVGTPIDNETIVRNENEEIMVNPNLIIDGGYL